MLRTIQTKASPIFVTVWQSTAVALEPFQLCKFDAVVIILTYSSNSPLHLALFLINSNHFHPEKTIGYKSYEELPDSYFFYNYTQSAKSIEIFSIRKRLPAYFAVNNSDLAFNYIAEAIHHVTKF